MSTLPAPDGMPDVPAQIFAKFLQNLRDAGAPPELVDQLRKTLMQDKKFTEHALKEAVFGTEAEQ
jgi:hypothetical protein